MCILGGCLDTTRTPQRDQTLNKVLLVEDRRKPCVDGIGVRALSHALPRYGGCCGTRRRDAVLAQKIYQRCESVIEDCVIGFCKGIGNRATLSIHRKALRKKKRESKVVLECLLVAVRIPNNVRNKQNSKTELQPPRHASGTLNLRPTHTSTPHQFVRWRTCMPV